MIIKPIKLFSCTIAGTQCNERLIQKSCEIPNCNCVIISSSNKKLMVVIMEKCRSKDQLVVCIPFRFAFISLKYLMLCQLG